MISWEIQWGISLSSSLLLFLFRSISLCIYVYMYTHTHTCTHISTPVFAVGQRKKVTAVTHFKTWQRMNRTFVSFIHYISNSWRFRLITHFQTIGKVLLHSWWRHQMETLSALLVPGEFPAQRPVTRSFYVFFDLRLNKRLKKQSWGWWFETLPRPVWRHSNVSAAAVDP